MKKAYVLLSTIVILTLLAFLMSFSFSLASYVPRAIKDSYFYIRANIIAQNSKELSKYLLYKAKQEGKECLASTSFSYNKNIIKIEYFYALTECKNFKFGEFNQDANLSKGGVIIVNVSVYAPNDFVNEEIFVSKKFYLYPKENFWQ